MSLTDKLRCLARSSRMMAADPENRESYTDDILCADYQALLTEAERLERLIVRDDAGNIVTQGAFNSAIGERDAAKARVAELEAELSKRPVLHGTCQNEDCNRVLHSVAEATRGTCASCWFKSMPADTRTAMNRLVASAFNGSGEKEKSAAVDDAIEKLRRDEKKGGE